MTPLLLYVCKLPIVEKIVYLTESLLLCWFFVGSLLVFPKSYDIYVSSQSHELQCEFMFVRCANNCGTFVYRADLAHHMTYDCSRRTVKCKFCHNDVLYNKEEVR